MSDTAYAVESYNVHDDGQPNKLLLLTGWFHSGQGVAGMQLALPGVAIPITDFREPSFGLIPHLGETGGNCRFKLETRFDAKLPPLEQGRLLILLANGDGMTIEIASLLTFSSGAPEIAFDEADQALVMRFEGLGDNCEFGLMQRRVGRERMSLLRYGGARESFRLVEAISSNFEGFGEPDDLDIGVQGSEWIVFSRRYGFAFHTGLHTDAVDEAGVRIAESRKLMFMANMLVEDLETCSKVFVRRVDDGEPLAGMLEIYAALRRKGPATLLWVTRAEDGKPHGTVEWVEGDLYRGYHAALAPYSNAFAFDAVGWVALLRRAEAVIGGEQPGVPAELARDDAGLGDAQVGDAKVGDAKVGDAPVGDGPGRDPLRADTDRPVTDSWRALTSDAPPTAPETRPAPEPATPPARDEPEAGGFWSRVLGRK